MSEWKPGDSGWAVGAMVGGPRDGKSYTDLPLDPQGEPPARVFIPLSSANPLAGEYAVYDRHALRSDGSWTYSFVGEMDGPPVPESPELPVGSSVMFTPAGQQPPDSAREPALGEPATREPAPRFMIAQSWWIAAELCRRHPLLRAYEMHPGGGQSDVLRIWGPRRGALGETDVLVDMNREGTIHLRDEEPSAWITWAEVMAAQSPHAIVKRIEEFQGLRLTRQAPSTTATSLVYRAIARLLNDKLNDRHPWDVRMEFLDSSDSDGSGRRRFVDAFPSAAEALVRARSRASVVDPAEHFWAILREGECRAVLDDAGVLHRSNGAPIELLPVYRRRRRLFDVLAVLEEAVYA